MFFSNFSTKTYIKRPILVGRFFCAPKRVLKLMDNKTLTILRSNSIKTCEFALVNSLAVWCVNLNKSERCNGVELLLVNVVPLR